MWIIERAEQEIRTNRRRIKMKKTNMKYNNKVGKIQYRNLKPSVRKGLREEGMYYLESIFGVCDGHGYGCGGEDISFGLKKIKAFIEFTDRDSTNSLIVIEMDVLYNQKDEELGTNMVDIRPKTMKYIRSKLCK